LLSAFDIAIAQNFVLRILHHPNNTDQAANASTSYAKAGNCPQCYSYAIHDDCALSAAKSYRRNRLRR
jgi:hypothetical protein